MNLKQALNKGVTSSINEQNPKYYYMFRIFNSESGEWKSFPSYEVNDGKFTDDKNVKRNINELMLNNDKTMNAFIKKSQKKSEEESGELKEESGELKEESEEFLEMLTDIGITENQLNWHPVFTIFSKQLKSAESKINELTDFIIGENLYKIEEEVLFDDAINAGAISINQLIKEIKSASQNSVSNNLSNNGVNDNTLANNTNTSTTPGANLPLKDNTSVGQNTNVNNNPEVGSSNENFVNSILKLASNTSSSASDGNIQVKSNPAVTNDQELNSAEFVNSLLKLASNTSSNTSSNTTLPMTTDTGEVEEKQNDQSNDQELNSAEFVNSILKLASNTNVEKQPSDNSDNSQINNSLTEALNTVFKNETQLNDTPKPLNKQQLNSAEFVNSIFKLASNTNDQNQPNDNNSQINNSLTEALNNTFKTETQPLDNDSQINNSLTKALNNTIKSEIKPIEESKQQLNSTEFVNSVFKLASTADSNLSNETDADANPVEQHEQERIISKDTNDMRFVKILDDVLKKDEQEYGESGINYYIKENVRFVDKEGTLIRTEDYYVKQGRIKSVTKISKDNYSVILNNGKNLDYKNTNGTNLYFKQIPEIDSNSDDKILVLKDLNITLQSGDCITFDEVIKRQIIPKTGRFVSKGVIEKKFKERVYNIDYDTGNKKINCIYYENWENDEWSSEKQGIIYLDYKTHEYSANWRTIKKCSQAEKDEKDKKDKETKEAKKALNKPTVSVANDNSQFNSNLTESLNNTMKSETQPNNESIELTKVLNDTIESQNTGGKRNPDRERVYKLPIHKRKTDNYYNYE
jgi:hypothetical protein